MTVTIEELTNYINSQTDNFERVTIRFEYLSFDSKIFKEAWDQVLNAVVSVDAGIVDPKDCRAETILLALVANGVILHGYTPQEKKETK